MRGMALASLRLLIFSIATCSFSWPAISDSNGLSGVSTMCMGNSTAGDNSHINYENNVFSLLSELASESAHSHPPAVGFFNATSGRNPNKAYGYYLCRADLKPKVCHDCVLQVTQSLSKNKIYFDCFGFGGSDVRNRCMVHYANFSMGYREDNVIACGGTEGKVSNYKQYNETLMTTVEGLIGEAAQGNWPKSDFEKRVVKVAGNSHEKIYTLSQCTPDISAMNCSKCLGQLHSYLPKCCNGTQGGEVLHPNCWIMFNNQSFFGSAYPRFMPSILNLCLTLLFSLFFL